MRIAGDRQSDTRSAFPLQRAMAQGILHQRLDAHGGHHPRGSGRVRLQLHGKPFAEAGLLHLQVGGDEFQLFGQRYPFVVRRSQRVAEHRSELFQRAIGEVGTVGNETCNRVQRVEQEVRIDLRAQGFQLGATRQEAQLLFALAEARVLQHEAEYRRERVEQAMVVAQVRHAIRPRAHRDHVPAEQLRAQAGARSVERCRCAEDVGEQACGSLAEVGLAWWR